MTSQSGSCSLLGSAMHSDGEGQKHLKVSDASFARTKLAQCAERQHLLPSSVKMHSRVADGKASLYKDCAMRQ